MMPGEDDVVKAVELKKLSVIVTLSPIEVKALEYTLVGPGPMMVPDTFVIRVVHDPAQPPEYTSTAPSVAADVALTTRFDRATRVPLLAPVSCTTRTAGLPVATVINLPPSIANVVPFMGAQKTEHAEFDVRSALRRRITTVEFNNADALRNTASSLQTVQTAVKFTLDRDTPSRRGIAVVKEMT